MFLNAESIICPAHKVSEGWLSIQRDTTNSLSLATITPDINTNDDWFLK